MRLCSPEQPYPGLRPFEPQEAAYFCGRKQEIRRLKGMIQEQRFVAVLGSSGAGKSSLVLAGVLPRLTEERLSTGEPAWQVLRMRPGGAPFRALADKAAELAHRLHPEQAVSGTALRDRALGLLRRGSPGLRQVAGELGFASGVRLLLIVDQFEELFRYKGIDQHQARREDEETRDRSDEAAAFAAALLAAPKSDTQPVHVVITMRSDFVGEAARFLGLPEAIDAGQFLVPRMSRPQMEAAIREPLKLASATISPALVQRLLNDTGTELDALPVMQHALLRTWKEAGAEATATAPAPGQDHGEMPAPDTSGRKLLPRHYEAAGTMARALSQHANAILNKLGEDDRELLEVARWLFRALADVDKEGRAVRRPQRYAELVALMGGRRRKQVRSVLDRFRADDCHFLTPFVSAVPRLKAETVIDVAHEALLRNWDKLRGDVGNVGWLANEFEDRLIWRGLVVEAEMFAVDPRCTLGSITAKKQEEWLAGLPSPYWTRRHAYPATDTAAGPKEWHKVSRLITASSRAADRQERRRQIKLGSAVFVAFVILALLVLAWWQAGYARQQQREAQRNADEAQRNESRALASLAENEAERGSPATAVRLALAALPMRLDSPDRVYARVAEGALLHSVQHLREQRKFLHQDWVSSVAFSADGRTLATGSYDRTARLWEVASGKQIAVLRGHEGGVSSVAFSADGRTLATGSSDNTARLWEVASGKQIAVLRGHEGGVSSVAFSADGRTLATGSSDNTARLWEVASGKQIAVLRGHERGVSSVAFSADGRTLATGSSDKTARLWKVASGKQIAVLRSHEGEVSSVAFSADGRTLATGSSKAAFTALLGVGAMEGDARLWEVASGKQIAVLLGHEGGVSSVAFSADGRTLATGSWDNTARLWEVASGKQIALLRGHERGVSSVAFSADGRTLATGSADGTARLWEVASGKQITVLRGHEGEVSSVAFSPDGRTLATGSSDKTARLWEVASGKQIAVLRGHEGGVSSVAFSADGRALATGSWDNTARLWEVASGKQITVLRGHEGEVSSVAFSADGRTLATGSRDLFLRDTTARLWEVASGKQIAVLRGHEGGVSSVAFSADGRTLATGSWDNTARLWEVTTGKQIALLRGHENGVSSVAFSADGRTLATGSSDKTARLWEVASGKQIAVLRGHEGGVWSVAFSPDGRTLATGSSKAEFTVLVATEGDARLWEVEQGLVDLACARVRFLPISEKDRQRFGITKEWCTPEVSAELRAKFGMDEPETSSAFGTPAR